MIPKRIAIFDLDGTLVETDAANTAAYNAALRQAGVGEFAGIYGRVSSSVVQAAKALSDSDMDALIKKKIEAYCHELWRTRLGPAANALSCILLNKRDFDKVVLLTDSVERRAMETLKFHGIQNCFDEIVCNGGSGNKYANYFKHFDSNPAACVVWENEYKQVQSAIAAGVNVKNIRKVG